MNIFIDILKIVWPTIVGIALGVSFVCLLVPEERARSLIKIFAIAFGVVFLIVFLISIFI